MVHGSLVVLDVGLMGRFLVEDVWKISKLTVLFFEVFGEPKTTVMEGQQGHKDLPQV